MESWFVAIEFIVTALLSCHPESVLKLRRAHDNPLGKLKATVRPTTATH